MTPQLTFPEIDELRAKIAAGSIIARESGGPVVNLIIIGGPLDGQTVTMPDDATSKGDVGWRVSRPNGILWVMHTRQNNTLHFTGVTNAVA